MYYIFYSKNYSRKGVNEDLIKQSMNEFVLSINGSIPIYHFYSDNKDESLEFLLKLNGYDISYQKQEPNEPYEIFIRKDSKIVTNLQVTCEDYFYIDEILSKNDTITKSNFPKGFLVKGFSDIVKIENKFNKDCNIGYMYVEQ